MSDLPHTYTLVSSAVPSTWVLCQLVFCLDPLELHPIHLIYLLKTPLLYSSEPNISDAAGSKLLESYKLSNLPTLEVLPSSNLQRHTKSPE